MQVDDHGIASSRSRRDRLAAADAGAVGAGVERTQRDFDATELEPRSVAQREVALLLEDMAGRRGLRAVRHLARALDRLPELLEEALALGDERGARRTGSMSPVAMIRS